MKKTANICCRCFRNCVLLCRFSCAFFLQLRFVGNATTSLALFFLCSMRVFLFRLFEIVARGAASCLLYECIVFTFRFSGVRASSVKMWKRIHATSFRSRVPKRREKTGLVQASNVQRFVSRRQSQRTNELDSTVCMF